MATLLEFVRMLVALSIVLGLVMACARLLGRRQRGASGARAAPGRRAGALAGLAASRRGGTRPAPARRQASQRGRGTAPVPELEVLARRNLSRTSSLLVVQAAGRLLLLGVTAQAVQLISELADESTALDDVEGLPDLPPDAPWTVPSAELGTSSAWDALLSSLRERTVRR